MTLSICVPLLNVLTLVLGNYKEARNSIPCLGDINAELDATKQALVDLTLCLFIILQLVQFLTLSGGWVLSWEWKMSHIALESPKLCSLPPTVAAFHQNVLRAHLAAAYMKSSLDPDPPYIDPEQYGWYSPEGHNFILPVVTPEETVMAPPALLKLVKCGCKAQFPCSTNICSCKKNSEMHLFVPL